MAHRRAYEQRLDAVRLRILHKTTGADALEVVTAIREQSPSERGTQLTRSLGLTPDEELLLWAVVAATVDPTLSHSLAALPGRDGRRGMSLAQFATAFELEPMRARSLALRVLGPSALVRRHLLASADHEELGISTGLVASERVAAHLAGEDELDRGLARCGGWVTTDAPIWEPTHAEIVGRVRAALDGAPALVVLRGRTGAGRRTLAASAAGRAVIAVDLDRVGGSPAGLSSALAAIERETAITGAFPMLVGLDKLAGPEPEVAARRREVAAFIEGHPGTVFAATTASTAPLGLARIVVELEVPSWTPLGRRRLWAAALGSRVSEEALALAAGRFHVGPGEITHAARRACAARPADATLEIADLAAGLGSAIDEKLAGIARRCTTRLGWDDLVLSAETREQIELFVARARHSCLVLEQWGMGRLLPSAGLTALFSGPPGTGKTMVAGLVARALGLELYRVDLSQVVSKWVGETEKQLELVFAAAETGHAMLLFDEADSLFAKRTDVKGANDRYANLEVNFLLQRLETFNGIAILTTNMDGSIDPAFRRRLAGHVRFPQPTADERALLWERMLPPGAPLAADIDLDELADQFDAFSGAHIRNAVTTAAFMAAHGGTHIDHDTLNRAAIEEARSIGRVIHSHGGL
ncbi:MAG: AAA family ATPase [Myxococcales bacterium]|nr:AAA family ATPase [Myxococcales bacterium]